MSSDSQLETVYHSTLKGRLIIMPARHLIMVFLLIIVALFIPFAKRSSSAATLCVHPTGAGGCFTTIQAAINAAMPGDTINVAPGTYNEKVQVNKTVILRGAQAGVDARTRVPANESIITHADGPLQIMADNVVIDGFTIQGASNDPGNPPFSALGTGIWTNPGFSLTQGGHQILNNIIQDNISGLYFNNTGVIQTTVQFNLFQNNNLPGPISGEAIFSDLRVSNALIADNKFTGHDDAAVLILGSPGTNITISENESTGNGRAFALGNLSSLSITGNISNGADFTASADIRIFGGINGLLISENALSGGTGDAIRINDIDGNNPNSNITMTCNSIINYSGDGLEIAGGYTGTLSAENNWWESATGPTIASNPGGTGETIVDPGSQVDYIPFLISGNDSAPSAPGFQCGSLLAAAGATITAEGCNPNNGAIDPGETVTVSFCVTNNGNQPTMNLVGTLQTSGGVTSPGAAQNYAVVQPAPQAGSTVCRDFTFTAANQACGSTLTATIQLQDGLSDLGTVTYTFTLGTADGKGGFVCCTPCTGLTCPANLSVSNDPNQCGAVVNYAAPAAQGSSCGTVTCAPASGSFFPVGTTTVSCDASGTAANPDCTFTVTVNDTQPPIITCPTNVIAVTAPACPAPAGSVTTYPPPSAADNCPKVTVVCVPPSGSIFPVGTTTVTCTATDAAGNTATCSFSVKIFNICVQDRSNPAAVLAWNTTTGEYTFCCNGSSFTGIGQVKTMGCTYTLNHTPAGRRVTGKIDFSTFRGEGSLQSPAGTSRCTISDNDVRDNDCACVGGGGSKFAFIHFENAKPQ
jgi:hypothetical protein